MIHITPLHHAMRAVQTSLIFHIQKPAGPSTLQSTQELSWQPFSVG